VPATRQRLYVPQVPIRKSTSTSSKSTTASGAAHLAMDSNLPRPVLLTGNRQWIDNPSNADTDHPRWRATTVNQRQPNVLQRNGAGTGPTPTIHSCPRARPPHLWRQINASISCLPRQSVKAIRKGVIYTIQYAESIRKRYHAGRLRLGRGHHFQTYVSWVVRASGTRSGFCPQLIAPYRSAKSLPSQLDPTGRGFISSRNNAAIHTSLLDSADSSTQLHLHIGYVSFTPNGPRGAHARHFLRGRGPEKAWPPQRE